MWTPIIGKKAVSFYNVTLISNDNSHYLNIYISKVDENIWVSVSKSEDGFHFKSPCNEANDLELSPSDNIEETFNNVKKHYLDKEYTFTSH